MECVTRAFGAATEAVLREHTADLVVACLPMTDDIGHELIGWCDEKSGGYRPDIANRVWSCIRRCYQGADRILGRVLDRAGQRTPWCSARITAWSAVLTWCT